jgi:hypothetical protein
MRFFIRYPFNADQDFESILKCIIKSAISALSRLKEERKRCMEKKFQHPKYKTFPMTAIGSILCEYLYHGGIK